MFAAVLRNSLSALRPLFSRPRPLPSFGPAALPSLAEVPVREKSCLKTNKSAAKRFIVRGKGRIKRGKAGRSHNTGHKGRKRVNRLAQSAPITERAIEERMRVLIGA